jgi:hypothetical protein
MPVSDWIKGSGKATGQRNVTAFFPADDISANGTCYCAFFLIQEYHILPTYVFIYHECAYFIYRGVTNREINDSHTTKSWKE